MIVPANFGVNPSGFHLRKSRTAHFCNWLPCLPFTWHLKEGPLRNLIFQVCHVMRNCKPWFRFKLRWGINGKPSFQITQTSWREADTLHTAKPRSFHSVSSLVSPKLRASCVSLGRRPSSLSKWVVKGGKWIHWHYPNPFVNCFCNM